MIVVDSSAIVAVLLLEPDAELLLQTMLSAAPALISAPTRLETYVSRRRRDGPEAGHEALQLMDTLRLATVDFDDAQLAVAIEGFAHWGRGRGRANLNYGDCFSYALAKSRNLPLLFKGEDFRATDVTAAI